MSERRGTLLEELRVTEEEVRVQAEELEQSHELLLRERDRYEHLFNHAPVPYLVTDENGTIRAANRAAASLLRCRPDRLEGKPLAVYVSQRSRPSFRQQLRRAVQSSDLHTVLLSIAPRVGAECAITGTVAPVVDDDGRVKELRWLLVPAQTTQVRKNDPRLAQAEEARSIAEEAARGMTELVAWASHELRTPAASIGGYADILALGVRGELTPDQQAILVRMQRAQSQLSALLEDLVTLARSGSGQLEFEIRTVTVADVVMRMLETVEPQAAARDLRMSVHVAPDTTVMADSERFLQILLNLMTNAVKFTPMGGAVTLGCDPDGDTVVITVSDTGGGIPADSRERVFRPYVRLDGARHARVSGAGLGLAISRKLARAMAGELVCVESRDGGSQFELRLPRSR